MAKEPLELRRKAKKGQMPGGYWREERKAQALHSPVRLGWGAGRGGVGVFYRGRVHAGSFVLRFLSVFQRVGILGELLGEEYLAAFC